MLLRALIATACCSLLLACGDSDDTAGGDTVADTSADMAGGDTVADTSGDMVATGPWSCVGNPMADPPLGATLEFSVKVVKFSGGDLDGVEVKVCAATDSACATPVTTATTDTAGVATFTITVAPNGFSGYAELSKTGYLPVLAQANVPITTPPPNLPIQLFMLTETDLTAAAAIMSATTDATRGQLLVGTWSCDEGPAAGATISVDTADGGSTPFVVEGTLPSATATESDAGGAAGVLNVPVGDATVTMTIAADGRTAGVGTIPIRAGWISNLIAVPNR